MLAEERVDTSTLRAQRYKSIYDPTYQGLLTVEEVERAVEMYCTTPFGENSTY